MRLKKANRLIERPAGTKGAEEIQRYTTYSLFITPHVQSIHETNLNFPNGVAILWGANMIVSVLQNSLFSWRGNNHQSVEE